MILPGRGTNGGLLAVVGLSLAGLILLPLLAVIGLDGGLGSGAIDLSGQRSEPLQSPGWGGLRPVRYWPAADQSIRSERLSRVWSIGPVSGCGQSVWLIEIVADQGRVYCNLVGAADIAVGQVIGAGRILGQPDPAVGFVDVYRVDPADWVDIFFSQGNLIDI